MELSNVTKKRIRDYLSEDKRFDGRKADEFRNIQIELGVSKNAEGSAKVTLGETVVVAGVKIETAEPYTDHEEEGTLITTAELLPLSSPRFEPGPPSIESIELARIIDRGIRESGFIDFKKLCIKKGEKVFGILLDIFSLNDNGNLLDAAALAAIAALKSARMTKYDEKEDRLLYGEFTNKGLPLTEKTPLTITFHKIGSKIVVDPNREEEETSNGRVSLALFRNKNKKEGVMITAAQKGNEATFSEKEMEHLLDLATEKFKELDELVENKLKKA